MAAVFPVYWRLLGLPISRAKGLIVDRIPFSLVETLIWIGVGCALALFLIFVSGRRAWLKRHSKARLLLISGPVLLVLMALGQGAFPLSMAPTAWRTPLARLFPGPALPYPVFHEDVLAHEAHLLRYFDPVYYESLSEDEIMVGCNQALDDVLRKLRLPPGREVSRAKPMGPLTTLLGLSYGGPAFHDPFLGELAIVKPADEPAPKYWRLMAVCHESAHAKGFTREMDAEILTQLALSASPDIRYQLIGDIMFLRKTGERIHLPEYIRNEIHAVRDSQERVEKRQWAVRALKKIAKKLGFQNSETKYGSRDPSENWNPHHPFFATVTGLLPTVSAPARATTEPADGP